MFAFAVYDGRSQSVFAARDRFGEKPLYVLEHRGTLYLASELKALVEAGLVAEPPPPRPLFNYFPTSYVLSPPPRFPRAPPILPRRSRNARAPRRNEHR